MSCKSQNAVIKDGSIASLFLKDIVLNNSGNVSVELRLQAPLQMDPSVINLKPKEKQKISVSYYPASISAVKERFSFQTVPRVDTQFDLEVELKKAKMEISSKVVDFGVIGKNGEAEIFCIVTNSGLYELKGDIRIECHNEAAVKFMMYKKKRSVRIDNQSPFSVNPKNTFTVGVRAKTLSQTGEFTGSLTFSSDNDFSMDANGNLCTRK